MSVILGQGFRPYLLNHIRSIVGMPATPQYQIEYMGFLNMLKAQKQPEVLRLNNQSGHRETVQIRYKQRYTKEFTGTSEGDVCNKILIEPRKETTVDLSSFRFIPLSLEDETVARYEDEASASIAVGKPATPMMNELLEEIYRGANAILQGMNLDLQTTAITNIGVNRVTGSSAAKTINISKDGTKNPLADGMNEILRDYQRNLGSGTPQIFGNGLFHAFMLEQNAKSFDQSGYNTAIQAAGVNFYFDEQSSTILGSDQIVVAQPDTVQLVEYMQFTGFKAGVKPGASIFGTIPLPMMMSDRISPIEFDFQLRYNDCATQFTDAYYGTSITMQKGWTLILSKKSGLFTIPSDAYRGTDPMSGNKGTLRYQITNSCAVC
jgi:hypothetical protein